jgi:hypothetical protein
MDSPEVKSEIEDAPLEKKVTKKKKKKKAVNEGEILPNMGLPPV